ncbi:MAG: lipoyl(octanoyl) transferase LipB [Holosporales bacterium]|jgi:lipoate-protein ligase B|nr:lipoyl(octanoyl) transferase LipB [Holosporales bacterium]
MNFIYKKGITPYIFSLIEMHWVEECVYTESEEETILIQQHEGVFSVGKSFEKQDFVSSHSFPVYYTKRGGRITVHNPGQIVVYPIVNIKKRGINVSEYVKILENWIIEVLKTFKIIGECSKDGIGIWVNGAKIGFIGIRIERGITTHGLCLNVNNDLRPFDSIIPCGIPNLSITSMQKTLKTNVSPDDIGGNFIKSCPF